VTGPTGPTGGTGSAALTPKGGDTQRILINDGLAADGVTVVLGGPETFKGSMLFSGGHGTIMYSVEEADVMATGSPPAEDTAQRAAYGVKIDETTGLLTVTLNAVMLTATINGTNIFEVELDIKVTAEDEAGTIAMSNVIAMRNRAPVIRANGGVEAFRIGMQAVERPATYDGSWPTSNMTTDGITCDMLNSCTIMMATHFMDENAAALTYTASSKDGSGNVRFEPVKGGIKVIGSTSTATTAGVNGATEQITVTVVAEDGNSMMKDQLFMLNVDAQPEAGDFLLADQEATIPITGTGTETINLYGVNPRADFYASDPEKKDLMYSLVDFKANPHATAGFNGAGSAIEVTTMTGSTAGVVPITVRATEPTDGAAGVGQWYDFSFNVTVK
jgi:hypothetical protein